MGIKEAALSISPATPVVNKDGLVSLQIDIATGPESVDTVDVFLNLDPAKIKITSVTALTGSKLPKALKTTFDAAAGTVDFSAGLQQNADGSVTPVSGVFPLFRLEGTAIGASPGTPVLFGRGTTRRTDAFLSARSVLGPLLGPAPPAPGTDLDGSTTSVAGALVGIAGVKLAIDPATSNAVVGDTRTFTVQADTAVHSVDTVDVFLNLDPKLLQVTSVTAHASTKLPKQLKSTFSAAAGTIDFSTAIQQNADGTATPVSGVFPLFTFQAKALAGTAANQPAQMGFSLASPRATEAFLSAASVLGPVTGAALQIAEAVSVDAAKSTVAASPASAPADGATTATVTVTLRDVNNAALPNVKVALSSSRGAADTTAPASAGSDTTNSSGVATFSVKSSSAGSATFTAQAAGVTVTQQAPVTFTALPVSQLVFVTQPAGAAGQSPAGPLNVQPVVEVRDSSGNAATTDPNPGVTETVSLSFLAGTNTEGAVLKGTTTVAVDWASGRAAFTGLAVETAGSYQLVASISLGSFTANSSAFEITPGPAASLAFTQQPGGGAVKQAWAVQPTVGVRDAFGNRATAATGPVALTIAANPGAAGAGLTCLNNPVSAVAGSAAFQGCSIDRAGAGYQLSASSGKVGAGYVLKATSPGLTGASSGAFGIAAGSPAKLAFTGKPGGAAAGQAWDQQPVVVVQDARGNTVTTALLAVTLSITPGTGPAGALVSCNTNPLAASAGVAAFAGCQINKSELSYTLTASAAGVTAAISEPFGVLPGPPARLIKDADPAKSGDGQTGTGNTVLPAPLAARVVDQLDNPVADIEVTFTVTLGGGDGAAVGSSTVSTGTDGTASATLRLGRRTGANTVQAECASCSETAGKQVSFTATATVGAAAILVKVAGDRQTGAVGTTLPVALELEVRDAAGNIRGGDTVTLAFAAGGVPAGATGQDLDQVAAGAQDSTQVLADADGRARATVTLGSVPGEYIVVASLGSLSTSFVLRAGVGAPHEFVLVRGGGQTGEAGAVLPVPIEVRVRDAFGNPAPNSTVVFAFGEVPPGATGQALSVTRATSGPGGLASTQLTLGNQPGIYTVLMTSSDFGASAAVSAVAPARFAEVVPDNPEVSATTTYRVRVAYGRRIPAGGSATLTFPNGFNPTSVTFPLPQGLEAGDELERSFTLTNPATCNLVGASALCANSGGFRATATNSVGESAFQSNAFSIEPKPPVVTVFIKVVDGTSSPPTALAGVDVVLEGAKTGRKVVRTDASGVARATEVALETATVRTLNETVQVPGKPLFSGVTLPASVTVQSDRKVPPAMPAGTLGSESNPATLTLRFEVSTVTIPGNNQTGGTVDAEVVLSGPSGTYTQTKLAQAVGVTIFAVSVPTGDYTVTFRRPAGSTTGFRPEPANRKVSVTGTGPVTVQPTRLERADQRLTGIVIGTDIVTGKDIGPVAGAAVTISNATFSTDTRTNGAGRFEVRVAVGASYTVKVSSEGFAEFPETLVDVKPGDAVQEVEVRGFRPGVLIKGLVTRGDSTVKDALVEAREKTGARRVATAVTGPSGAFAIAVPTSSSGTEWGLTATVQGYGDTREVVVKVLTADVTQNIALAVTASLTGTVIQDGKGGQGASIAVVPANPDVPPPGVVNSDSNGGFTVTVQRPAPGDPPFGYVALATVPGVATALPEVRFSVDSLGTFLDANDNAVTTVSFRFATSTITFKYSQGVKQTTIGLRSKSTGFPAANMKEEGTETPSITQVILTVPRPADGTSIEYEPQVSVTGFKDSDVSVSPKTIKVPGQNLLVEVSLPAEQFTLSGVVTSGGSQVQGGATPVSGATVSAVSASFSLSTRTDANGRYSLTLPRGTYDVNAAKQPELTPTAKQQVTLDKNTTRDFNLAAAQFSISGNIGLEAGVKAIVVMKNKNTGQNLTFERGATGPRCSKDKVTPTRYCGAVTPGTWDIDFVAEGVKSTGSQTVTVINADLDKVNLNGTPVAKGAASRQAITKSGGGSGQATGSLIKVIIPPGALGTTAEMAFLSIKETTEAPSTTSFVPDRGLAIDVVLTDAQGRELRQLNQPATLRIEGFTGAFVGVFDPAAGDWRVVSSCVRDQAGVTCSVPRFSKFTLMSKFTLFGDTPPQAGGGPSGGGGGSAVTPTPTPVPSLVNQSVNLTAGGTVTLGGTSVQVPQGAVTGHSSVNVSLETTSLIGQGVGPVLAAVQTVPVPEGSAFGSGAFTFTLRDPAGNPVALALPVTVTTRYTVGDRDRAGGNITGVRLMAYDPVNRVWVDLKATADEPRFSLTGATTLTGLFAVVVEIPRPVLVGPAPRFISLDLAPLLAWSNPPGTTQYQIQVTPFNNDGPGINLIRNPEESYQVQAPVFGTGNYVMLPGMTYTWRVRTSTSASGLGENDPGWSGWVSAIFRTAAPTGSTIGIFGPISGSEVAGPTTTLTWTNANKTVFYYEVQVSKDPGFGPDAFLYWELRHGAVSTPQNSYLIPDAYPLEAGTTYHWRVRPRVQGDGTPVEWSTAWSFVTPQ